MTSMTNQASSWRAAIDSNRPGAGFFLTRSRKGLNPLSYLEYRGATSANQVRLMRELSNWINYFSTSDHQTHRDISAYFNSYSKKAISEFWATIISHETQEQERAKMMEKRKDDLRRQNVLQLCIDGDAMTEELKATYGTFYSSCGL